MFHRVAHLERHRDAGDRHSSRRLPFVGRGEEMRRLLHALRGAATDLDTRIALITGAPGAGKTRMAEELLLRGQRAGARVASGRAWAHGGSPPLWPWQAVLRDLQAPSGLTALSPGRDVDEQFGRFAGVLEFLQRTASSAGPLLIVLDDVDLVDEATLLLASFVVREQRRLPLLLVMTRREGDETATAHSRVLLREIERNAASILLRGLSAQAARTFLRMLGVRSLGDSLFDAVVAVTLGNPLHLRQVAIRTASDGDVARALARTSTEILDRLPPAQRRTIAIAALLGVETTVDEIASVAGVPWTAVEHALSEARAHGVMARRSSPRVEFVHDLVREAAVTTLAPTERLAAHAVAATALKGNTPTTVLRRTHHALEAAARSTTHAALALRVAQETATRVRAIGSLEAAAELLNHAVNVHDAVVPTLPVAALVAAYAESLVACGRLTEARSVFDRAVRCADAEGDAIAFARAALGLGGIWLREHRCPAETNRVAALQRRALAALPSDAAVLRARLQVRLAAEAAYGTGEVDLVERAVATVRRTGDACALAEALSLYHHVLAAPELTSRRLAIAEELIAAAAEADDTPLTLAGLCWRAADLFLLGDPRADAALLELRSRADAMRCRSILFIACAMGVMQTIRAGRLDEAESAAQACYALGREVGDVDALAYYGAHLAAIRFFQGRESELADLANSIARSPTLIPERERSFALAAALFALRAGHASAARQLLEHLSREGIASLPRSSSWFTSMLATVEIAAALDDAAIAGAAYDALLPFANRPVMASLVAVVCFGSTHRLLGLAAATCGESDRAIEHFRAAISANERIGHRPAAILARAELGFALMARGRGDDADRGRSLVEEAIAAAAEIGLVERARHWRHRLPARAPATHSVQRVTFARSSQTGYWTITYGEHVATVADRVGLRYLAQLVASPDCWTPALALVVGGSATAPTGGRQRMLDAGAVHAIRDRIAALRSRPVLSDDEEEELTGLTRELSHSLRLGGRTRDFVDVPERARTAVRKAIARAIEQISSANAPIGAHLAASITTGTHCRYRLTQR